MSWLAQLQRWDDDGEWDDTLPQRLDNLALKNLQRKEWTNLKKKIIPILNMSFNLYITIYICLISARILKGNIDKIINDNHMSYDYRYGISFLLFWQFHLSTVMLIFLFSIQYITDFGVRFFHNIVSESVLQLIKYVDRPNTRSTVAWFHVIHELYKYGLIHNKKNKLNKVT